MSLLFRWRIGSMLLALAAFAIAFGAFQAVRIVPRRIAPETTTVVRRSAATATVRVRTGIAFLPAISPATAAILVATAAVAAMGARAMARRRVEVTPRTATASPE